ncbi:YopX family protein [Empedobacter falsenii]
MREILFRGQRIDNGEWVYGQYLKREYSGFTDYSVWTPKGTIPVKPESIGQFTGLLDKNRNKIFEGDKFQGDENGEYYVVNWNEDEATFQMDLYGYNMHIGEGSQEVFDNEVSHIDSNCFELSALKSDLIIGNIHEEKL